MKTVTVEARVTSYARINVDVTDEEYAAMQKSSSAVSNILDNAINTAYTMAETSDADNIEYDYAVYNQDTDESLVDWS